MHKLTEEYKNKLKNYEDFKLKIEVLIRELLIQDNISYHKIESRIKDPNRLEEKIHRKNDKYEELTEITDIVGIRVITYFEDEVDKVARIIDSEFTVDKENSIDKRQLESDRFGYKSLHYVVSLTDQRKKLTEYKRFKDIKFEIQIRSILQHAWAEIEHDIGYKGEHAIPDFLKRNFYRVAALLETADIEFVNIRKGLEHYEQTVGETIKKHPEEVEINSASLNSFISTNPIVSKLNKQIIEEFNFSISSDSNWRLESYVERLIYLNIKTVKELDIALKENQDKIIKFAKEWIGSHKGGEVGPGISIFYLCYVIVGQSDDIEFANYYSRLINKKSPLKNSLGQKIIDTYKKIK